MRRGSLNVRFQPYRLENSRCWKEGKGDARITCLSCHDPHQPLAMDPASYDSSCLQCHRAASREEKKARRQRSSYRLHGRSETVRDLPHAEIQESVPACHIHRSLDSHRGAGSAFAGLKDEGDGNQDRSWACGCSGRMASEMHFPRADYASWESPRPSLLPYKRHSNNDELRNNGQGQSVARRGGQQVVRLDRPVMMAKEKRIQAQTIRPDLLESSHDTGIVQRGIRK